jgi:hypothetical protein
MIRAIAREMSIDADEECNNVMNCKTDELSKKAASSFIQHFTGRAKRATGGNADATRGLRK